MQQTGTERHPMDYEEAGRLEDVRRAEADRERFAPADPHIHKDDKKRAASTSRRILNMLRLGPVSNQELASVCLRYSARIHDLREHGFRIVTRRVPGKSGLHMFELIGEEGGR